MFLTLFFIILMVIVLGAVFFSFARPNQGLVGVFGSKISSASPTILTSLGILGTFIGISYALLNFDTYQLEKSIPILLDGMKMAFITSAVGIAFSILLKIMTLALDKENEAKENKAISESLEQKIPTLMKQLITHSEKKQKTIENFEKNLLKAFNDFGNNLSDKLSQHIIDGLEGIVINFNDSLEVQFGENFAHLDNSVKEMLKWQQDYKSFIENIVNKYYLSANTMVEVKEAMIGIEHSLENIPELIKDFEKLIKFNQKQIGRIGEEMMIFTDIKDKALSTFPDIQAHFDRIARNIEDTSDKLNNHLAQYTHNMGSNLSIIANRMMIDFENNSRQVSDNNQQSYQTLLDSSEKIKLSLDIFNSMVKQQLVSIRSEFTQVEKDAQDRMKAFQLGIADLAKENKAFIDVMKEITVENRLLIKHLEEQSQKGLFDKLFSSKK